MADSELLMVGTPGGVPLGYPSNVAAVVCRGSLIVMQVHITRTARRHDQRSDARAAVTASLNQQGLTAPHDVALGETTLDEMCLANVTALYPAAAATAN